MKLQAMLMLATSVILGLGGCDSNDLEESKVPSKGNVNGLVVIPRTAENNVSIPEACGSLPIPGGYVPLEDANVSFVDINGSSVQSQLTDMCGRFYSNVQTDDLTTVRIVKQGFHTMLSDVTSFDNGGLGWGIVSTADTNNSFAVRINADGQSMTYLSKSGNFKYSVIDTKSSHAVLGIPQSQVSLYNDVDEEAISAYVFNDLDADLVLCLDASGSMDINLTDANGTSIGTGFDVTYDASKTFIDELSGNAQLGITIFDDKINFIDRSFINALNLDGSFDYALDGFERDKKKSKFVIDIYHPYSHVYDENSSLVPEYDYMTENEYLWNGATAYIDAASTAVTKLDKRSAEKKIVVLMTDGMDNSSSKTVKEVVDEAVGADVTFYTISMGSDTDDDLKALATGTNGVYIQADGSDISEKFSDVLSEIQYFYEVGTTIEVNTTAFYRVDINVSGEIVSGLVEYNSTVEPEPDSNETTEEQPGAQLYIKCKPCHGSNADLSPYGVTRIINQMDSATLKNYLTEYKAGSRDSHGYGALMTEQLLNYDSEDIDLLSEYIPTLQ